MVSQSKVDAFIEQWKGASKSELRARLSTLKTKVNTDSKQAEIKAITFLLQ